MSENQEKQNNSFELIDKISKKHFLEIEHTVPHFQQILFDFQNEWYKTWKNSINANVTLQKEFSLKTGFDIPVPVSTQKIIENMNKETAKYRSVYNKIIINTIETGKKNAKMWNDNMDKFVDLNQKIMQYWLSSFSQK